MMPISVIILTKNEEKFIERCINSVTWADEVLVLDSGSTDKTIDIAFSLGAVVHRQEWLGWTPQRSKGITLAKNDWVFILECDEIVTPELAKSIQEVMNSLPKEHDGYSVDRRGDFLGILLPNMSRKSKKLNFIRLFNRKYSAYDPSMKVHEEVRFTGKAIALQGVLLHWRGYTIDEYISVFNRYAITEAEVLYEKGFRVKRLTIVARPILRFLWCYIARGGFRCGTQGLIHAILKSVSEYIRYAKVWEMQNPTTTIHPPKNIYLQPN